MQNTSADYKLEINKPSRSFECKVTIGNNIYNNEDIVDIILDYPQASDGFTTVSYTHLHCSVEDRIFSLDEIQSKWYINN